MKPSTCEHVSRNPQNMSMCHGTLKNICVAIYTQICVIIYTQICVTIYTQIRKLHYYTIKSTLGHKTDKTTHRELKLIGFVSVFDSASKKLLLRLFTYKSVSLFTHKIRVHMYKWSALGSSVCYIALLSWGGIGKCTCTLVDSPRGESMQVRGYFDFHHFYRGNWTHIHSSIPQVYTELGGIGKCTCTLVDSPRGERQMHAGPKQFPS